MILILTLVKYGPHTFWHSVNIGHVYFVRIIVFN